MTHSVRRPRLVGLFVAGAIATSLSFAPAASAQGQPHATGTAAAPNLNDAKKHYGEGEKKFKAGDFAGALTEFQAADAIKSTPQSQRYIGICHDNLGHFADAVASYDKFLAAPPASMAKEVDEIKKRSEQIKAMPGRIHVETTPAGASIVADGKPMGTSPADVELAPGKHVLHLELAGHSPIDKDVDVAFGSKQDLRSELTAKPAETVVATTPTTPALFPEGPKPEPKPEAPKEPRSKLPAFITGGLAIVAIGVGTGFGIAALGKKSDFDKNPSADLADTGENFALVADMAFGVAITLGVTSAVLFLTNDDDSTAKTSQGQSNRNVARAPKKTNPVRIVPTPFIVPNGGGAGAFMRF